MLTNPMFTVQIMVICTLLWTLGRTELLEPLEPNMNRSQIYSTTTNVLYDCSALTAMKGNLTTGGEYLGIIFPIFSFLSKGTVLLEPSTKDCFESENDALNDPQTLCYLNLARNCENSIYWYPYKSTGRLRRKYKKLNKRNLKENLSILEALELDICQW